MAAISQNFFVGQPATGLFSKHADRWNKCPVGLLAREQSEKSVSLGFS
jgi:hypothetical protein